MSSPTESSTNEYTIGFVRIVLSRLKPDAKHKDLTSVLQVPLDALLKAMGGLIQAKNLALDDQGFLNYTLAQVTGPNLDKLALKVAAHFDSKTAAGALAIFPKTPAVVTNAPLRDQPTLLAAIAAALNDPATPKEVKALAKDWLADYAEYTKALAALAKANATVVTSAKAVTGARTDVFVALAKLRGELIARNPRKAQVVRSFYPRPTKKVKKAAPTTT